LLQDTERNEKFDLALKAALSDSGKNKEDQKGQAVLDIGTGSGLLSLLAAKHGARFVTACDTDLELCKAARQAVVDNGFTTDTVKVLNVSSMDLHPADMNEGHLADVLVSEVLDSGLIGEDVLPTLRDARARLCKPNCKIIPSSAQVYAQIIHSPTLRSWHQLPAAKDLPSPTKGCAGPGGPLPLDLPSFLKMEAGKSYTLADPISVFDFDFVNLPPEKGRTKQLKILITKAGSVHAVCFWWTCELYKGISFSTSPEMNQRRRHWSQAVCLLPTEQSVKSGEVFTINAFHNDDDIWFRTEPKVDDLSIPECICCHHLDCNDLQMWRLNDMARTKSIVRAFNRLQIAEGTEVICPIDNSMLVLLCEHRGATIEIAEMTEDDEADDTETTENNEEVDNKTEGTENNEEVDNKTEGTENNEELDNKTEGKEVGDKEKTDDLDSCLDDLSTQANMAVLKSVGAFELLSTEVPAQGGEIKRLVLAECGSEDDEHCSLRELISILDWLDSLDVSDGRVFPERALIRAATLSSESLERSRAPVSG